MTPITLSEQFRIPCEDGSLKPSGTVFLRPLRRRLKADGTPSPHDSEDDAEFDDGARGASQPVGDAESADGARGDLKPAPSASDGPSDKEEYYRTMAGEYVYRNHVIPRRVLYFPNHTFPIPLN